MTENELKLLELAKEIIQLNVDNLSLGLTGSLMLKLRGIETRREAKDIDLLSPEGLYEDKDNFGYPIMPTSFKETNMDGYKSQVDAIQFTENESGVKIDVMYSDEIFDIIDGVPCGSIFEMIYAKVRYMFEDKSPESREKHKLDVDFLRGKTHVDIDKVIKHFELSKKIQISDII